jgi:hypothetical protein
VDKRTLTVVAPPLIEIKVANFLPEWVANLVRRTHISFSANFLPAALQIALAKRTLCVTAVDKISW